MVELGLGGETAMRVRWSCLVSVAALSAAGAVVAQETPSSGESSVAQVSGAPVDPQPSGAESDAEPSAVHSAAESAAPKQAAAPAPPAANAPALPALNLQLQGLWSRSERLPSAREPLPEKRADVAADVGGRTLAADRARSEDDNLRPMPGAPERAPVMRVKKKF
jgi:hypothetical protein